ncbi:MAG: sigma-54-dependent Fis family transcriptional regulator [Solirubrobacterales bacterium]
MKAYVEKSKNKCEMLGLDKTMIYSRKIIKGRELEGNLENNKDLIIAALPFIDQLYSFVKGSSFFTILTDAEGCILNVIGDEKILSEAFMFKMIPGAYMNDENIGTNAMSIVINEGQPVQIEGKDHFIEAYNKWTCSAAPIKDADGKLIGVIDLTGYTENVHPHTLGMVVAAAFSIEKLIADKSTGKTRKMYDKLSDCKAVYTFNKIIGSDEKFLDTINYSKKVSRSKSTILITGESGTGKEVFAQSIHNYSDRNEMPFVAVNCGAIPRNLIESELFGYEDGAFTGSKKGGADGKFQCADGGSIFLDEIGEMPIDMQVRLLRVIEEGVVTKVGGVKQIPVNVRIIAATNKDLKAEAEAGKFRKDLYYRLNVLPIYLIPLRERKGDIVLLLNYYINKISKKLGKSPVVLKDTEIRTLVSYDWPGNIRELQNIVELIINTGTFPEHMFKKEFAETSEEFQSGNNEIVDLQTLERQYIIKALIQCDYNISKTAKKLGVVRNTLYKKIKEYSIECSNLERCSKNDQLSNKNVV